MFLHCRYINARAQASASWFDNAREGKRTLARKHGHLRVLLLSASESERGFGSVLHHHQCPNPYRLGFFLPVPPVKPAMTSRASLRQRRDFPPDSPKFLSLLSVGTRALATPLRVFTTTYRQQVRQVIWSRGGESEKGLARYARIHAGCLRSALISAAVTGQIDVRGAV